MRVIPALAAMLAGIFRRKPKRTLIETPFLDVPAPHQRAAYWKGRTKIAPGVLRRRARQKNRRAAQPIDRSRWTRETTTVALTHREPDGTRSTFEAPVWTVERAPWAVRR